MKKYAQNGKNAAELAIKEIEHNGGISINGKKYTIQLIETDNKEDLSFAVPATLNNIAKDKVIAIVGPFTSAVAVTIGGVANGFKIPMITPWASANTITKNRKYVFRLSVGSNIQAKAIPKFAKEQWSEPKMAILYDELGNAATGIVKMIQKSFAKSIGKENIVAIETFRGKNTDVVKQLKAIAKTDASFIFAPIDTSQALSIIKQAKEMGIKTPFIGGDWWNSKEFAQKCGEDCEDFNFVATFVPRGALGNAEKFVNLYKAAYNSTPTEEAALTYDAVMILAKALSSMPKISGNILQDREVSYRGSGEPERCALFVKIKNGELLQNKYVCP